jgi:K+-sensing histidine kinase KdpD
VISAPPLAATVERSGLAIRRPLAAVGLGTAGVLIIAVALVPFHATVPRPIPIVLLLLPVVAAGVVGGRLAAGAVTVEAVAVLATGFLPPVFSPRVTLAEDIAALAVFFAVAVVLGSLVAHVVAADRHRIALGEARAMALEQVDRQRRTLLSSVSHDLRTPLATIRAVATDLWSGAPHDESTRTELLGLVVDESERLDRIVANLLSLSRIEGGTFSPDRQPVDVTDLVRTSTARSARLLDGLVVSVDAPDDLPPVLADHTQIDQVVTNLLENAARHSPAGAPVRVEVAAQPGRVVVAVSDAGPGLDPALRQRVFEPFRTAGDGVSTGIGLATCKAIVEAHGGTIAVRDGRDGGACFTFSLPLDG